MTTIEAQKWLEEFFEYEYCSECGGDSQHHEVCSGPFGNPFAKCKFPPSAETRWEFHPVIQKYHREVSA